MSPNLELLTGVGSHYHPDNTGDIDHPLTPTWHTTAGLKFEKPFGIPLNLHLRGNAHLSQGFSDSATWEIEHVSDTVTAEEALSSIESGTGSITHTTTETAEVSWRSRRSNFSLSTPISGNLINKDKLKLYGGLGPSVLYTTDVRKLRIIHEDGTKEILHDQAVSRSSGMSLGAEGIIGAELGNFLVEANSSYSKNSGEFSAVVMIGFNTKSQ